MSNTTGSDEGSNTPEAKKSGRSRWTLRQWVLIIIGLGLFAAFSVVATDATDYTFSTMQFCAHTCHVMEDNVYAELEKSKHWKTPTGVRPTCADCHVSRRLSYAMVDHFLGTKELFVMAFNDFSKPGSFEKFRPEAANWVRFHLLGDNSAACKTCHVMEAIKPKRLRGQNAHNEAVKNGNSNCIACHYNLVHKKVEPSKEFLDAASKYIGSGSEEEEQKEGADEFSGAGEQL